MTPNTRAAGLERTTADSHRRKAKDEETDEHTTEETSTGCTLRVNWFSTRNRQQPSQQLEGKGMRYVHGPQRFSVWVASEGGCSLYMWRMQEVPIGNAGVFRMVVSGSWVRDFGQRLFRSTLGSVDVSCGDVSLRFRLCCRKSLIEA